MCVTLPDGNKHVVTGSLDDTVRVKVRDILGSGSFCMLLYTGSSCFAYNFGTFNSWETPLVLGHMHACACTPRAPNF